MYSTLLIMFSFFVVLIFIGTMHWRAITQKASIMAQHANIEFRKALLVVFVEQFCRANMLDATSLEFDEEYKKQLFENYEFICSGKQSKETIFIEYLDMEQLPPMKMPLF